MRIDKSMKASNNTLYRIAQCWAAQKACPLRKRPEPAAISMAPIDKALASLPSNISRAIRLRYGLDGTAKFRPIIHVAQFFWEGRGTIYQWLNDGIKMLRDPLKREILEPAYKIMARAAFELFKGKSFLPVNEFKTALIKRGLLEEKDEIFFPAVLYLLDDALGPNFQYINLQSGKITRQRAMKNIGLRRMEK